MLKERLGNEGLHDMEDISRPPCDLTRAWPVPQLHTAFPLPPGSRQCPTLHPRARQLSTALLVQQREASDHSDSNRMGGPFSAHEALPMLYSSTSTGQGVVPLGWFLLVPSCQASFLPNGSELQCGMGAL